jgi:hypothetical protein
MGILWDSLSGIMLRSGHFGDVCPGIAEVYHLSLPRCSVFSERFAGGMGKNQRLRRIQGGSFLEKSRPGGTPRTPPPKTSHVTPPAQKRVNGSELRRHYTYFRAAFVQPIELFFLRTASICQSRLQVILIRKRMAATATSLLYMFKRSHSCDAQQSCHALRARVVLVEITN